MPPAVIASDVAMSTIVRLAVCDARLAHHPDAVGDGLDAGVRAAAQRVGAHEELERAERSERRRRVGRRSSRTSVLTAPQLGDMAADRDQQQDRVRDDEDGEDRRDRRDRFLDAAEVHHRQREPRTRRSRRLDQASVVPSSVAGS